MCGRFNVTSDPLSRLLMELLGMPHPGPDNFNAAPTESIVVARLGEDGAPELVPMRWWLTPFWAKEMSTRYSMFNAKSEKVHQSPAFREPFRNRRCVVPVSGFYEWSPHRRSEAAVLHSASRVARVAPGRHLGSLAQLRRPTRFSRVLQSSRHRPTQRWRSCTVASR